jgi:sulfur-carrier protein adenylyltransferase/sulfurtransferase
MSLNWQGLIERVKKEIRQASTDQLMEELNTGKEVYVVDVREQDEFERGHIPGALFIPRGFLELRIENTIPDRNARIYLYCGGGNRSALAARSLQEMGYTDLFSLESGFSQWQRESKPVEEAPSPDSQS